MANALGDVVGRERELAELGAFLAAIPDGPRALLLEGDAGIGKTTVWLDAVRSAEQRGYRVLHARPAESESRLSYAALADVVGPVFDEVRSVLPDPQEGALATVMLREATDGPADARTIATALVSALAELADQSPVLLALDDAQWLDHASARALEFAARRLPPRLGVLATLRTGTAVDAPLGLDRALPASRFERVAIGPLSLAALRQVITAQLQTSVARPVLARIAEASGCNPFFALEMARNLTTATAGDPLPLPRGIAKLALERIERLSPDAREAVLVAALLSRPTVATVTMALPPDVEALPAIRQTAGQGTAVTKQTRRPSSTRGRSPCPSR
jgi:hypothetical protein